MKKKHGMDQEPRQLLPVQSVPPLESFSDCPVQDQRGTLVLPGLAYIS